MKAIDQDREGGRPDPGEGEALIQAYLDEDLDAEEFERLQLWLKRDASARRRLAEATEVATLLREEALADKSPSEEETSEPSPRLSIRPFLVPVGVAAAVALAGFLVFPGFHRPETGARLVEAVEVNWLSDPVAAGEAIPVETEIRLASGRIELEFESGASTRILGPAHFVVESGNGGFLHYGKAHSVAETESSMGFTVRTASGDYIDQGTVFVTEATADGFSQMFVIEGAVDADANGFGRRRVSGGNGIGFELRENPIMIQIEQGTGTPDFVFPTIPPPSAEDFASVHPVAFEIDSRGEPSGRSSVAPGSAPVEVLVNGRAQQSADDPSESFFFTKDSTGFLTIDLGAVVPVTGIHTYSWHRNDVFPEQTMRAVQRYILWGARETKPESLPNRENPGGWERIARVDTDAFFEVDQEAKRPPQQACRIVPSSGAIGEYRYLLFKVFPTSDRAEVRPRHTFLSEIDVFTE